MAVSTILYDDRTTAGLSAAVDGDHLWLTPAELQQATGWKLEPEGLCRGDACVRLNAGWQDAQGRVDLAAFARYMGQPVVREDAAGAWAFGESASTSSRKRVPVWASSKRYSLPSSWCRIAWMRLSGAIRSRPTSQIRSDSRILS